MRRCDVTAVLCGTFAVFAVINIVTVVGHNTGDTTDGNHYTYPTQSTHRVRAEYTRSAHRVHAEYPNSPNIRSLVSRHTL